MDAERKKTRVPSVSHDSAAKITARGVVWIAIFLRAKNAKPNLMFLKKHLISASNVYFRHANAVQNDLAAQNIEARISRYGLAASAKEFLVSLKSLRECASLLFIRYGL